MGWNHQLNWTMLIFSYFCWGRCLSMSAFMIPDFYPFPIPPLATPIKNRFRALLFESNCVFWVICIQDWPDSWRSKNLVYHWKDVLNEHLISSDIFCISAPAAYFWCLFHQGRVLTWFMGIYIRGRTPMPPPRFFLPFLAILTSTVTVCWIN